MKEENWRWVFRRPQPGDTHNPDPNWDATMKALGDGIDSQVSTTLKFEKPTKLTPREAVVPFKGTVRVKTHVRRKK